MVFVQCDVYKCLVAYKLDHVCKFHWGQVIHISLCYLFNYM